MAGGRSAALQKAAANVVSARPSDANIRRITVVGCGHVGLVMAAGFAHRGHAVTGLDRSPDLVAMLAAGTVPFHEAGLTELMHEGIASGRLRFTTTYAEAVPEAEIIFLTVDTPGTNGGAPDLRNIHSAATGIARSLNGTAPIIVNKSTSPIGTGETIEAILRRDLTAAHKRPRIVSNPEFLRQGHAVHDFFNPDRVVIGAQSETDAREIAALYDGLGGAVMITDLRTAEMIKYVANSFLAMRISFINEIAQLCEAVDVDIDAVVNGVGSDSRIGTQFLRPGIGYGGSCLPKDVAALRHMGDALGVATPVLSAVQQVNGTQPANAVRKLRLALGHVAGKVIGIWGLTFKGNTEDTRQSPAVDVVELLLDAGAQIRVYDPSLPRSLPEPLRRLTCADPLEAVAGADALAVLTDWPEFRAVSMEAVRLAMSGNVVLDGRNTLDRHAVQAIGLTYIGTGRGRPPTVSPTDAETQLQLAKAG
jgi:UDPglucose 6-dehydrogenase